MNILSRVWQFVKKQWLFFVTVVIGVLSLVFSLARNKNANKVMDLNRKAEDVERDARTENSQNIEDTLKDLSDKLIQNNQDKQEQAQKIIEENREELKKEIQQNKDKSVKQIADDFASKYGLNRV